MMKKFAVVLSGCGVFDGAEIHEATLSMLAIARQWFAGACLMPPFDHYEVLIGILGASEAEQAKEALKT